MEEKLKGKSHCKICGLKKTIENTYVYLNKLSSYCKSCEKIKTAKNKRVEIRMINKTKKRSVTPKIWEKTNKNHYPDSEWVWAQIEMNEAPSTIMEKMDQKYALSVHGNTGRSNRWKNNNNNKPK